MTGAIRKVSWNRKDEGAPRFAPFQQTEVRQRREVLWMAAETRGSACLGTREFVNLLTRVSSMVNPPGPGPQQPVGLTPQSSPLRAPRRPIVA